MRPDDDEQLFHDGQQRRQRLRRGAVDFVGDEDVEVRVDGTVHDFHQLRGFVVDFRTLDVRRQEVGGEGEEAPLAVLEAGAHRVADHGLTETGDRLQKDVAGREPGGEDQFQNLVVAGDELLQLLDVRLPLGLERGGGEGRDLELDAVLNGHEKSPEKDKVPPELVAPQVHGKVGSNDPTG